MSQPVLEMLSMMLEYPKSGYPEMVKECCDVILEELNEAQKESLAKTLSDFRYGIIYRGLDELEELYTRTFDLNPVCSLDIGWHLYAENYDRGAFLVKMREALRMQGIPETTELPDHLPAVLTLLSRIPAEEAGSLARESVLPALRKMSGGFTDQGNPYCSLIRAIEGILSEKFSLETRSIQL